MNHDEWLESLKIGDRVYLIGIGFQAIREIERLTPTGRIILKGSNNQFIGGRHRIDNWNSEYIVELTDEMKTNHQLKVKLQRINKMKLTLDDVDKINKIYDILYK